MPATAEKAPDTPDTYEGQPIRYPWDQNPEKPKTLQEEPYDNQESEEKAREQVADVLVKAETADGNGEAVEEEKPPQELELKVDVAPESNANAGAGQETPVESSSANAQELNTRDFEHQPPPPSQERPENYQKTAEQEISSAEQEGIENALNKIGGKIIEEWRKYARSGDDNVISDLSFEIIEIAGTFEHSNDKGELAVYDPTLIALKSIRNIRTLIESGVNIQEKTAGSDDGGEGLEKIVEVYICDLPKVGADYADKLKIFLHKLGETLVNRMDDIEQTKKLKSVIT